MESPQTEAAATETEKESQARMSPLQRLIGTLFSPSETFQDVNRKPDWILPIIVAIIIGVVGNFIIIKHLNLDPEKITRQAIEQRLEKQGKSLSELPPEQQEAIDKQGKIFAKVQPILLVIFPPLSAAFLALLFWAATLLFDGGSTYKKVFSVTAYVFCVVTVCVQVLLNILVAFLRNPEDVDVIKGIAVTNPGMLMPSDASPILSALLSRFDIFSIWFLILMTLGLAAVCRKMKVGKAATITFGLWGIWIVVRVAWAAIFKQ